MIRNEMRMQLWIEEYKNYKGRFNNKEAAVKFADEVLEVFDKRFPPSQPESASIPMREIKDTGELGVMLDTERAWIKCKEKTPESVHIEYEVLYIDASTDLGWFSDPDWFTKKDSVYGLDKAGKWSVTEKTVVAWRHLPK